MRKAIFAVLLLAAPCAYAAQQQFSFFLTPESVTHSETSGTDVAGGIGASWIALWTPRVSTELSVGVEQSYAVASTPTRYYERRVKSYPIDALVQYRFVNQSKWTPYIGGGLRYAKPEASLADGRGSAEVNGGVVWQFSTHWGLRVDLRQLLNEDKPWDRSSKGSIGFTFGY